MQTGQEERRRETRARDRSWTLDVNEGPSGLDHCEPAPPAVEGGRILHPSALLTTGLPSLGLHLARTCLCLCRPHRGLTVTNDCDRRPFSAADPPFVRLAAQRAPPKARRTAQLRSHIEVSEAKQQRKLDSVHDAFQSADQLSSSQRSSSQQSARCTSRSAVKPSRRRMPARQRRPLRPGLVEEPAVARPTVVAA